MLPHDAILHYGVKGMKWDKRKRKLDAETEETTSYTVDPETGEVVVSKFGRGVPLSITENMDQDKYSVRDGELHRNSAAYALLSKSGRTLRSKLSKNSMVKYQMSFESGLARAMHKPDPNKKYKSPKRNYRKD